MNQSIIELEDSYRMYLNGIGIVSEDTSIKALEILAKENSLMSCNEYVQDLYKENPEEFADDEEVLNYLSIEQNIFNPDTIRDEVKQKVFDIIQKDRIHIFVDGANGLNYNIVFQINPKDYSEWEVYKTVQCSYHAWGFSPNNEFVSEVLWYTENYEAQEFDRESLSEYGSVEDVDYSYEIEDVVEKAMETYDTFFSERAKMEQLKRITG